MPFNGVQGQSPWPSLPSGGPDIHPVLWRLALAVAVSAAAVGAMTRLGALDHPGPRSSHARPTPKGGGLGVVAACLVGFPLGLWPVTAIVGALAALSYADDVGNLSFKWKLAGQLAAAMALVYWWPLPDSVDLPGLGVTTVGAVGRVLTVAWILFVTNAVNFMDGLDGLVAGAAAIVAMGVGLVHFRDGGALSPALGLPLAAGLLGFLPFNFRPHRAARIFMGDVGSQPVGFLLALLALPVAGAPTRWLWLGPAMMFGLLYDVAFTLARRFRAGDRLTEAHRGHLYQVAQRSGVAAYRVTLIHWAMALWGAGCAVLVGNGGVARLASAGVLLVTPQLIWTAYVATRAKRAGLSRW